MIEKKIVLDPVDFAKIVDFLSLIRISLAQSKVAADVLAAVGRAKDMEIEVKETNKKEE